MHVPERSLQPNTRIHLRPRDQLARMLARPEADLWAHEPLDVLERRVAEITGKPAALVFPTGTMAQQVALRVHAERAGRRAFAAHPLTHLDLFEERAYAVVHGLRLHPAGDRNELLTADALAAVREPLAAVLWELPQRELGGLLPEWDDLVAQTALARERGAACHLDGARLWESQPFYDRPHAEIAGLFDSVYVSLYKGLHGVRGAVLAGSDELIGEARVWRQRLGGAIDGLWPLALLALDGLDTRVPRMAAYRDHAVAIAAAITAGGRATVRPDPPQTPMFHLHLPAPRDAVREAAAALVGETGTQILGWVASSQEPRRCVAELTIGEESLDFTPAEVAAHVETVLDRAADLG